MAPVILNPIHRLADVLNDALPQTQCTRCGYPDCRSYAQAMAEGSAPIDQCPPGGQEGIDRLARIVGQTSRSLNPAHGAEAPRLLAVIDETWCIGCTLCLKACPVDAIIGGSKSMHTVVDAQCTGCELCIPACPVDCISLHPVTGERTGWDAWSQVQAAQARDRHAFHQFRSARDQAEQIARLEAGNSAATRASQGRSGDEIAVAPAQRKSAAIEAVLARARAARQP